MAHEFIRGFHEIEGVTISERQRNLNKFLKNIYVAPEERTYVLDTLKPKTYLEHLFYVDVLICLRDTDRLFEIFKNGNGVFVSKIMKQSWFFQEVFNNVSAKDLVDNILPVLSFTVKIKLLKKLSQVYTENKIDEVFDYTLKSYFKMPTLDKIYDEMYDLNYPQLKWIMNHERIIRMWVMEYRVTKESLYTMYGLSMAVMFISACSIGKIKETLKFNKIKLSTHQLKSIHKKERDLISIYIEEQKHYNSEHIFDNNFLTYLAQNDPLYFWELLEKHKINNNLKLGRRTTKKLLPTKQHEIVTDPNKYIKYFRYETLVRKLNKQGHFKQLYYNLFPRNIQILGNGDTLCNTLLKFYPKRDRYNLFTKTFNDVTKEDIWHYACCIDDNLLELVSDREVRERWAHLKYHETNDDEYLKLYEIKKSITLIKEKIKTTASAKNRAKLISLLVKCCAINKDLKNLEEVLKYFCGRHRNDDKLSRSAVLKTIENNFHLEELDDVHWKYIKEIFTIQSLNNETLVFGSNIRIKHIEYLFKNNGSEDDKNYFILEYIKEDLISTSLYFSSLKCIKNLEVQRSILLLAVEYIDTVLKNLKRDSNKTYYKSQILTEIFFYNLNNPENKIQIFENNKVFEMLKQVLKGGHKSGSFQQRFAKIVCKLNRNTLEDEVLTCYFEDKTIREFSFDLVLRWYLKYDPLVVINNINKVMEALPLKREIWRTIKLYNHLVLDDKVVKYCMHQLTHSEDEDKVSFIQPLSILSSAEYYAKIIDDLNFMPASSKLVIDDVESRKQYTLQKTYLQNFVNVEDPLQYLPLLLDKFCQGDYLQGSLAPLYCAFHNTPEDKLQIYIDDLKNKKAMSAKKHALFLACSVLEQEKVIQILNHFQDDKNESLQKSMCLSSLQYFTKNPNQVIFEKMLSSMRLLRECDTESLEILAAAQVPRKYKSAYIMNIWDLLEHLKVDGKAAGINTLMTTVLRNINRESITILPKNFCKDTINKYFLTNEENSDEVIGIIEFAIKFLMYYKNQTENFTYIFSLLSNYKQQNWASKVKERKSVYIFFNTFYTLVFQEKSDINFITTFCTEWEKIFTPSDTFKEHVLLNLLKFKTETKNNIELYSERIAQYAEQINTTYGEFIFSKFIPIFAEFYGHGKEEKVIELMTSILKNRSILNCILIIETIFLKGNLYYKDRINPMYKEIYFTLQKVTDPKVQLCYNLYSKID